MQRLPKMVPILYTVALLHLFCYVCGQASSSSSSTPTSIISITRDPTIKFQIVPSVDEPSPKAQLNPPQKGNLSSEKLESGDSLQKFIPKTPITLDAPVPITVVSTWMTTVNQSVFETVSMIVTQKEAFTTTATQTETYTSITSKTLVPNINRPFMTSAQSSGSPYTGQLIIPGTFVVLLILFLL